MGICVVPECKHVGSHRIPKDKNRRSVWIKAMNLDERFLMTKYPKLCTLHFKDSDYTDYDIEPLNMKRRNLKKHAIPSVFPLHQASTTNELMFISIEEANILSDSESRKENSEPRDPLVESMQYSENICSEKQSLESQSTASDVEDCYRILCPFNTSGITKTYSRDVKPVKFAPKLPYAVTGTATDETTRNPLLQESFEGDHQYYVESDIDVANNIEIEDVLIENNIEIADDVMEQTENIADNISNSAISCLPCVPSYSIHNYKNEKNALHFYTGLETFDKLMFVFHSLGDVMNLNYFYGKPPSHLDPLEQFCMTLLILRRHREFQDIAFTYKTSMKQVTNIFITWIRFMALQWRTINLWLDRDAVTYYMPHDFNDKYPNTRVIIDATECPIRKPHLPRAQQITFSTCKNSNTVKFLVGVAPSGLITYISPCYGGSASYRQIIERSSILNMFDHNDEIMVDKGLNVQDIFLSYGIKVNMPTFCKKSNQINPDVLTKDQKIASKRVHVKRIIGMLKTYKILTQPMNPTETLLSSEISFVVAMLVNFISIRNKNA